MALLVHLISAGISVSVNLSIPVKVFIFLCLICFYMMNKHKFRWATLLDERFLFETTLCHILSFYNSIFIIFFLFLRTCRFFSP